MHRLTGLALVFLLAAACGSNGSKADAGSSGQAGSEGVDAPIDYGAVDANINLDAAVFDTQIYRDGAVGTPGAAGATGEGGTAGTTGAAGTTGNAGTTGGAGTTGNAGTTGGAGTTGTAGSGPPTPGVNVRVFKGLAAGLDQGASCTHDPAATGDRWCAFMGESETQGINLFVVNVSKAVRGVPIACETTTDPNCILLTGGFAETEDGSHAALFQGDTLVYFDSTGTPYGWRPGMSFGRRLVLVTPSTPDVWGCVPAATGTGVACLRDLPDDQQSIPTGILSDVLVGKLDGPTNPPLSRVDTVISLNQADVGEGISHFAYAFPTPGHFAWSSRATANGVEILKVREVDSTAAPTVVSNDAHDWAVSSNGTRWYWQSAFNPLTFAGTLRSAPFPAGTNPDTLATNVLQYGFPTPTALVTVNEAGALAAIADPINAPAAVTALDSNVLGFLSMSTQGHVSYVKLFQGGSVADLYSKKWDGTQACPLSPTMTAFFSSFDYLPSSKGAVWGQQSGTLVQGVFSRLSDCNNAVVATNIDMIGNVGDAGVLFRDAGTHTIRYRAITSGDTLSTAAAALISTDISSLDIAGPSPEVSVLFSVQATQNGDGPSDGMYVRLF